MAKNQAKSKQRPEAKLLLFENYSLSLSRHHPKLIEGILKKCTKKKYVYLNEVISSMTMKRRLKMKNRSHRYGINRPAVKHGHRYTKYKMVSQYSDGYLY